MVVESCAPSLAALLLTGGSLGELYGRRRILGIGFARNWLCKVNGAYLDITCILQVMLIRCRMCLGSLSQDAGPAAR